MRALPRRRQPEPRSPRRCASGRACPAAALAVAKDQQMSRSMNEACKGVEGGGLRGCAPNYHLNSIANDGWAQV